MAAKINPLAKRVSIFLTVDNSTISSYFNQHDPGPIYNRQLSFDFEEYLNNSVVNARRHSTIRYKVTCAPNEKKYADPVLRAIKRHYQLKKTNKEAEFKRFKKKAYLLLVASFLLVIFCQWALPLLTGQEHRVHSALSNALDVFSWVILWKPIERLIFYWNPFLKEISLYDKMVNAEAIIIEKPLVNGNSAVTHNLSDDSVA
jgi:hypothetical protein